MSVREEILKRVQDDLAETRQRLEELSSPRQIVHEEYFDSWSGDVSVGNEERQNLRDRISELEAWLAEEDQLAQIRDIIDQVIISGREVNDKEASDVLRRIREILGMSLNL